MHLDPAKLLIKMVMVIVIWLLVFLVVNNGDWDLGSHLTIISKAWEKILESMQFCTKCRWSCNDDVGLFFQKIIILGELILQMGIAALGLI